MILTWLDGLKWYHEAASVVPYTLLLESLHLSGMERTCVNICFGNVSLIVPIWAYRKVQSHQMEALNIYPLPPMKIFDTSGSMQMKGLQTVTEKLCFLLPSTQWYHHVSFDKCGQAGSSQNPQIARLPNEQSNFFQDTSMSAFSTFAQLSILLPETALCCVHLQTRQASISPPSHCGCSFDSTRRSLTYCCF